MRTTLRSSWFHKRMPIWITEYGQQTKPENPHGVTKAKQAIFAKQALAIAKSVPTVDMFCWFVIRDSNDVWKSGFLTRSGAKKPGYAAFSSVARLLDGQTFYVKGGTRPTLKVFVPYMAFQNQTRNIIGMTYKVLDGTKVLAVEQPTSPLGADESITFKADFVAAKGKTYNVTVDANDQHGNHETRTAVIVAS